MQQHDIEMERYTTGQLKRPMLAIRYIDIDAARQLFLYDTTFYMRHSMELHDELLMFIQHM